MSTTITAIATAPGRGAIAIIRVSGPASLDAYKKLTRLTIKPQANKLSPVWLYSKSQKIDHSMAVYFAAPHSFTGEDMLEIHCHGSEVVKKQILSELYQLGVEPAKPGEFSERAYYNGKIDITQAEAIMELVAAENTQVAKLATRQLAGEFSIQIKHIRDDLTSLSASIAADMDFSEEDLPLIDKGSIVNKLTAVVKEINLLKSNSELLPKLHSGIHVALVGLPNAGKSTLLNSLLGYDRSIVTNVAGTTRDTISENIEIDGVNYIFTDTAGLNDNPDEVEAIGIERTTRAVEGADVVLILIEPGKQKPTEQFIKNSGLDKLIAPTKSLEVHTKSDIKKPSTGLALSAKNNQGIEGLIEQIKKLTGTQVVGDMNILTQRQTDILSNVENSLINLLDNIQSLSNDIVSAEIESIIAKLNELTGDQANQQIIDSIFRNFCIGK